MPSVAENEVPLGSYWARSNGKVVKVVAERPDGIFREVYLKPVAGGGRSSWKWDESVRCDLHRLADYKELCDGR